MSSSHDANRRNFLKKAAVTAYVAPLIVSTQAHATYSSTGSGHTKKDDKKSKGSKYSKDSKASKGSKYSKGSQSEKSSKNDKTNSYSFKSKKS